MSLRLLIAVMTAFFLIIILGATDKRAPAGLAPVAIGLGLTLIHLVSIPVTNTSVNPARSTGPALFAGGWAVAYAARDLIANPLPPYLAAGFGIDILRGTASAAANVLEGIGLIEKRTKNHIAWIGNKPRAHATTVTITASDEDGGATTARFELIVENVVPIVVKTAYADFLFEVGDGAGAGGSLRDRLGTGRRP